MTPEQPTPTIKDLIRRADAIAILEDEMPGHYLSKKTQIVAKLRALPAYEVAVRELAWVYHGTVGATWAAIAPFGAYVIIDLGGNWDADRFVLRLDQMRLGHFATAEAAKAAAQADYAARIRSAMTATPAADVAGLVEALGAEYVLDHPLETSEERMGRHSAVRGIAVRMGCYPQLEAGIDAAIARMKEAKA